MFPWFKSKKANLMIGDVVFESIYHYPTFPHVVVSLRPLTTMLFHYVPGQDSISYFKMSRLDNSFDVDFDELPDPVMNWIDVQVGRYLEEGVVPKGGMVRISSLTESDGVSTDSETESNPVTPKPKKRWRNAPDDVKPEDVVNIELTMINGSRQIIIQEVLRDSGLVYYHAIKNAIKKKDTYDFTYADGTKITINGAHLVMVKMRNP